MFHFQHPVSQRLGRVLSQHRHHGLRQNRTMIQVRRDSMHRAAVQADARL